jgi:phosphomannomutase
MPERDGLLCVLYLLEMVALTGKDLTQLYQELQEELDYHSVYDRIDLKLPNSDLKNKLVGYLEEKPFTEVDGLTVTEHLTTDGHRFRLAPGHWLLIRFSGTEPLLRLYCEGPNPERVAQTLAWAKDWALSLT